MEAAARTLMPGSGLYVYCLVEAAAGLEPLRGVDALGLTFTLGRGSLAALVSEVALADYREQELARRLDDPAWVKERVERHDAVVRAALRRGPVIPVRFGAIYTTASALHELLDANHAEARSFVDFVRDKQEWGIKVFSRCGTDDRPDPGPAEDATPAASGSDYLLRKQSRKQRRETRLSADDAQAGEIYESLATLSTQASRNRLLNQHATGEPGAMILNAAFLVENDRLDSFLATVDTLAAERERQGLTVKSSGPWAPYNFCPQLAGG